MTLKTSKLNIFDGVEVKYATFQKIAFPLHFHDTYSIGIIKEGVENLVVNNRSYDNPSKTIVILNQYEAHANAQYDEDSWTYLSFYLSYDTLQFINKRNNFAARSTFYFQNVIQDQVLYETILKFHHCSDLKKENLIKTISADLITRYQVKPSTENALYKKYSHLMTDTKDLFRLTYFNKINIDSIAKKYRLSTYAFIRAFKAHTGLTPLSYLILMRLNQSKKLMMQNLPLVEVALECGFYDQSHFCHYFKKFFGLSPLAYKKSFANIDRL